MNRILCFLLLAIPLAAQTAFRVDPTFIYTTPGNTPPGANAPVFAVPGATISVCSNSACTSQATTYTSGAASSTCPVNAQVTLSGASVCRSTTGPLGAWGAWLLPGDYWYTVTVGATTSGPYPFTVGSGSGGAASWSTLTPGTSTLGAYLVGSGASISPVGAGTVNANVLGGILLTNLSGPVKFSGGIPSNAASADIVALFTGCSGSLFLVANGTCATGGGSVTSVGLSAPAWLTVTGSPVTVSGTLGLTPTSGQTPHQVIGTCNAATTFAPCTLVPSDITLGSGVVGVLLVANGGTNCSVASITCFNNITGFTASGSSGTSSTNLLFSGSPTIVTPTIASFTNATHNHSNAAGGGTFNTVNSSTCTGTPSSSTFLRGDCTWQAAPGDVVGPGSSTDNALARFDGTTGKLIQNSAGTLDDSGNLSISGGMSAGVGSGVAGAVEMLPGTAPSVTANSFGWRANTNMTTAVSLQSPNALPVANSVMLFGAPSSNVATWVYTNTPTLTGTNFSGIPVSAFTGLGTGVGTALGQAVSGSGGIALTTSPSFTTPALGTPSALVCTNCTGSATGLTAGISLALKSASTTVDVSAATAPSAGQVLQATDSTHATWQTPSGAAPEFTDASPAWVKDEFCGGDTDNADVGELGWFKFFNNGAPTVGYGTAEAAHPCIRSFATVATDGNTGLSLTGDGSATQWTGLDGHTWKSRYIIKTDSANTNLTDLYVGFGNLTQNSIIVVYEPGTSANWLLRTISGFTATDVDTGVAYANSTWFDILLDSTVAGTIGATVNAGSRVTSNTNVYSGAMRWNAIGAVTGGSVRTFLVDLAAYSQAITR